MTDYDNGEFGLRLHQRMGRQEREHERRRGAQERALTFYNLIPGAAKSLDRQRTGVLLSPGIRRQARGAGLLARPCAGSLTASSPELQASGPARGPTRAPRAGGRISRWTSRSSTTTVRIYPGASGEHFPERVPPAPMTVRAAAALVAHVLHTPVTALDEAYVEDLLMWAEDAREVARASAAVRHPARPS